ncbi:MAG: carboxypeptidase regulatory-like domain-containing protein [Planctomycetes bacterium]|nr:carboxypeptidase regulatory-like domain-containing protein [Planctomycetota bacterium]
MPKTLCHDRCGRRRPCVLLFVAASFLTGCGEPSQPVGDVYGKVTYRGQPVASGSISFQNAEIGYGADAKLGSGGEYHFETLEGGLPLGNYKVTVMPEMELDASDPKTPPVMKDKPAPNIPKKYRLPRTSDLTAAVKEGENELNFDMK